MTKVVDENKQLAKELAQAVSSLDKLTPWPAMRKLAFYLVLLVPTIWAAWSSATTLGFVLFSLLTGLIFASLLVTTHDCIHETFTGIKWFDQVFPRLISWPLLWPHGVYDETHKLHHMMNGQELRDPERITFTESEYLQAGALKRFYIRHQWAVSMLLVGGVGLIYKTLSKGLPFAGKSKGMRRNIALDAAGILLTNGLIYGVAYHYGVALKYLAFYIILERVAGFVMQFRLHIEHYGLWGKAPTFYQAQVVNCRNFTTNPFMAWYYNSLCYHTVHHAFPNIPFYALRQAHVEMDKVYAKRDSKIPIEEDGYFASIRRLVQDTLLIKDDQTGVFGGSAGVLSLAAVEAKQVAGNMASV